MIISCIAFTLYLRYYAGVQWRRASAHAIRSDPLPRPSNHIIIHSFSDVPPFNDPPLITYAHTSFIIIFVLVSSFSITLKKRGRHLQSHNKQNGYVMDFQNHNEMIKCFFSLVRLYYFKKHLPPLF